MLTQQLDDVQTALEAAEMDRQVLAAQRDGWMASFQVNNLVAAGILVPTRVGPAQRTAARPCMRCRTTDENACMTISSFGHLLSDGDIVGGQHDVTSSMCSLQGRMC